MRAPKPLLDVTGTVSVGEAAAVADAADRLLEEAFGAGTYDRELLRAGFTLAGRLFAGEYPGYLACDMPYHDLRHTLDTALVMARLVAGYQRAQRDAASALTPEHGLVGVLLAVLHDTGYLRRSSEAALCGAQLATGHEARSVEFAGRYLRTTSLAGHAALAPLILATWLGQDIGALLAGRDAAAVVLGRMLGTADLLSQISDRDYLERCYYHLYPELCLGGCDRVRTPDGGELLLYRDALDLVRKTPAFYDNVVRPRLDDAFRRVARHLAAPASGADPYASATRRNLERAARIAADGTARLLRQEPVTTTHDLAPAYRAVPSRAPLAP